MMTQDHTAEQRATITSADPAAGIPPLRADQTTALAQLAVDAGERRAPQRRAARRSLITGVLAGAAAVVVAAAVVIPFASTVSEEPVALQQVPGGIAAKCMEPQADALAESADALFRADVSSISGGIVTLRVTDVLAGETGTLIEVDQGDGMISDAGPIVFDEGASYLLATSDGVILSCGWSGLDSPWLEDVYLDAATLKNP